MVDVTQTSQRCELITGPVRLECELSGDRWRHVVSLLDGTEWTAVLSSLEGTPAEELPPSPVFQEMLLEEKSADVAEVQLIGRAGKNLYAAAITLDATAQTVHFDVSVRWRAAEMPKAVESRYLGQDWTIEGPAARHRGGMTLEAVAAAGWPAVKIASVSPDQVRIACGGLPVEAASTGGTTVRWQYRISWGGLA